MARRPAKTCRIPPDVEERFGNFQDDHDLNDGETMRRLLDRGLTYYGYENGHAKTWMERTSAKLARALLVVAVSFLLVTLATGVRLYAPAVAVVVGAGALMLVQQTEPSITKEVRRLR